MKFFTSLITKNIPQVVKKMKSIFFFVSQKINTVLIPILAAFLILLVLSLFILRQKIEKNALLSFSGYGDAVHVYPLLGEKPKLYTTSPAYIVYEKDSRIVVFGKNEHLRFSPASTVKIMTALVALDYYGLDLFLKVNGTRLVEGSKVGFLEGEEVSVENLLYGLLLPSGNDSAYTLAQNYPGGTSEFVRRMNEKARSLKLSSTSFVDPTGLSGENYTSAFDLARLASFALNNSEFKKIVKTKTKVIFDKDGNLSHKLVNLNKLLQEDNVSGVKTGFTEEAGGVLVTSYESEKTYIVVVLKSEDRFKDTEELISSIIKDIRLISYR